MSKESIGSVKKAEKDDGLVGKEEIEKTFPVKEIKKLLEKHGYILEYPVAGSRSELMDESRLLISLKVRAEKKQRFLAPLSFCQVG